MAHYFKPFPKIDYDLKKNGKSNSLTNITLRFKVQEALLSQSVIYYDYQVQEEDRPDIVAELYYQDSTLDWLILIVNDIIDPQFEWPKEQYSLDKFIRQKYGSISEAQRTVHHYEKILNAQSTLADGTIVPERTVKIDQTTYNSLAGDTLQGETGFVKIRREVSAYQYEQDLNDERRNIKLLDEVYLPQILSAVRGVFA
tara:strand:- start:151 stop:747 length:597 start_codon:yes stop_codon:yes gene_type:complete